MAKKASTAAEIEVQPRRIAGYLAWGIMAGAWLLVAASLASHNSADPVPAGWPGGSVAPYNELPRNWAGAIGAALSHKVYHMIGYGAWVFMAGWLAFLVATARGKAITQPVIRFAGLLVMTLSASALLGIATPESLAQGALPYASLIGFFINTELTQRFNTLGTMIILGTFFWVGAILAMDQFVLAIPRYVIKGFQMAPKVNVPRPVLVGRFPRLWGRSDDADAEQTGGTAVAELDEPADEDAGEVPVATAENAEAQGYAGTRDTSAHAINPGRESGLDESVPEVSVELDEAQDESDLDGSNTAEAALDDDDAGADAPGAYLAEKKQAAFDPEALRAKIKSMPINFAPKTKTASFAPREIDLSGYRFPGMDVLVEPESNFTEEMERVVRDQAIQLEQALQQYRIEGEVVGIDSGPVITLFEVRLAAGTKVAALNAVASDLARALKAHNIRVVPNMAGKDTVGIEVPNTKKEKVRLKELMNTDVDNVRRMGLPMFLGKDASGNALIADLAAMPHMLIAGTTGSGKSVCMNSIIMSFLFTKRPDELKLVLVDPKMVEMSQFKDIPHLMCPVVTEMGKAAAILEWAVTKMDERYELLAEAGVRDITGYNGLGAAELKERFNPANEAEEARIPKKLPYMVFIIDELADLMMTNKEVEGFIVRIAQKARAVGMHLILATQRPQANVVTGLIKSNMPCRVSFKVASGMDSRIVLDQKGGELLLGHGDMLFLSPRTSKLTRAQGTLVDDLEIRKTVKFLKEIAEQNFEPQLVQIKSAGMGDVDEEAAKDPLFDEAVRCVLQTKRGSVSLLQRRLTIGYSRASRLIEAMAVAGILGDYKGSQAREVTITLEEWEAMRDQMEKDAAVNAGDSNDTGVNRAEGDKEDWANEGDDEDGVPDELDGEYRR